MDFIIPSKMCMAIGVYGFPLNRIGISKGVYLFGILGIFSALICQCGSENSLIC